jgi:hypothetical protein
MNDVFTFIRNGLNNFSDNGGIYDIDLKNDCIILNELLNKIEEDDYEKHLTVNKQKIKARCDILFEKMQFNIYTNLQEVLNLLFDYQDNKEIQDPDDLEKDIRDHYFHSLQCFLLSLSLYPVLIKEVLQSIVISDITSVLFSLCMYHDIGYLYNVKKPNVYNINTTMNTLLLESNKFTGEVIIKILSVIFTDTTYQRKFKKEEILEKIKKNEDIKNIWKGDINFNDESILYEITRASRLPQDPQQHHSFMSAVFLERVLQTIRAIKQKYFNDTNLPGTISINTPESIRENEFVNIIRAILLHGLNLSTPITLKNDFFASFLIIIDELQTYGRLPQNKKSGKEALNPKYIGFEWINDSKKLKLTYDEEFVNNQCNIKISEAYKKHNNIEIIKALKSKVNESSIEFLMPPF